MIIQELCRYYERVRETPAANIAEPGFGSAKIHAEVVLDKAGNLVQFNDLRRPREVDQKLVPHEMIVPQPVKRSGVKAHESPNFLWDTTAFALGAEAEKTPEVENKQKTALKFKNFKKLHSKMLKASQDLYLEILVRFLEGWNPAAAVHLDHWEELAGGNVVFRLEGEREYFHQKASLRDLWLQQSQGPDNKTRGMCLVYGTTGPIERIHPDIRNVRGANTKGASIVSFNEDAYESYGKTQNFNSPMSKRAAFAYSTALNYLLRPTSKQKMHIGDCTVVFWTERESAIERLFGQILEPGDLEAADNKEIRDFLDAMRGGKKLKELDDGMKFYILGLSPNAARLSVRLWHASSVGDIAQRIGQHFRDLQIEKSFDSEPDYPGIWSILRETCNKKSKETAAPLLAGALLRSVMLGTAYPQALFNAILNRIRAETKEADHVNYIRAAVLKAILCRKRRLFNHGMEVPMTLDKDNHNAAYLLGRLFAVLEKTQKDALGTGINATIKDRYFGAASATPKMVFPQLMRLGQHHIAKAEYGSYYDKLIEEIVANIQEFPAHLTLDEQGMFCIGYYHQRRSFFSGKESRNQKDED